jgi:hypothetical protein
MSQADASYVAVNRKGEVTSYVGPDATYYYAMVMLQSSLKFWQKTKMRVNRHVTVTDMLARASRVTQKQYKRTQVAVAIADLEAHLAALRSALPVVTE